MARLLMISAALLGLLGPSGVVWAYVLEGPGILQQMIQSLGLSNNLLVSQKLLLYFDGPEQEPVAVSETLRYQFPLRFRSDTVSAPGSRIHLFCVDEALTITNGLISSTREKDIDHYKDILLFNNLELLQIILADLGVDTAVTSLGRFGNQVVYIIGARFPDASVPQLWIDKKNLHPMRFLIRKTHGDSAAVVWEFRYSNWRKTGNAWYPQGIEVYQEGRLLQALETVSVQTDIVFSKTLFDIKKIRSQYPEWTMDFQKDEAADPLDEVRKAVEDFRKMYD